MKKSYSVICLLLKLVVFRARQIIPAKYLLHNQKKGGGNLLQIKDSL